MSDNEKIVIAGGTGFIGEYLKVQFEQLGKKVIVISRSAPHIRWGDEEGIIGALDGAEMLINLAGKSVNCRYNEKNKAEILNSRTLTTKALGEAILKCENPPALWLNSSTATIYRHAEDRPMTEDNGEIGTGFSVDVATSWETAFFEFKLEKTRQIAMRIAIVLGQNGGVMAPYKNLVRFGLGGQQGDGNAMFSWLHCYDLFKMMLFFQERKELEGVYNCSAPNPVDNKIFMKTLRNSMGRSLGLPAPKWLLGIGAFLIGTERELILKSRWVLPQKLEAAGFEFKFLELGKAFDDLNH